MPYAGQYLLQLLKLLQLDMASWFWQYVVRLQSVRSGFDPRSGNAAKSHSGWPGRYIINVRFFLHACPGLQVTKGVKGYPHTLWVHMIVGTTATNFY